MGQLPEPASSEPADPTLDTQMNNFPNTSKEPEPDAIIDWLFDKKNIQ
ncbi:MAG: hypothetical protein GY860_16485, partial [Desulfobacteraceae bacterium]|nr:hypothetical protein [Desulfobacteraceae bacterium]